MTGVEKENLSTKLENSFLGILRIVILVVLTVSLIGSAVFAYLGVSNLNATPEKYEYRDPSIQDMVKEIRKALEDKEDSPAPQQPREDSPKKNEKLDQEIDKQVKLISEFLQRYKRNLTNPDAFKAMLKTRAETLAFNPEKESSVLKYAEGQTELFQKAFADKEMLALVDKRENVLLERFFVAVRDVYPNYFRKEKQNKAKFEAEQNVKVATQKAGAAMNLYIAAGMFSTFLMISLILVLVKIERNLRVRPI